MTISYLSKIPMLNINPNKLKKKKILSSPTPSLPSPTPSYPISPLSWLPPHEKRAWNPDSKGPVHIY